MNKYQKHIVCSYDYKLVCADKFSKPFNSYLGEDTVFICINSMIKENFEKIFSQRFFDD